MPFNYDIDYVKVWQQRQDCSSQTFTNTNETIYNSKVYKNVSITGTSVFDAGISHLCGQEYVLLDAGTEISGTAEVIIDTRNCLPAQVISPYAPGDFPIDKPNQYLQNQLENVKKEIIIPN